MSGPRRPNSVKIGPLTYAIGYESDHLEAMSRAGESDHQSLIILINDTLHPMLQKQVMIHEILHACFYSISRMYPDGYEHKVLEEEIASALESPIFGVLRDNPVLLKWVTS